MPVGAGSCLSGVTLQHCEDWEAEGFGVIGGLLLIRIFRSLSRCSGKKRFPRARPRIGLPRRCIQLRDR